MGWFPRELVETPADSVAVSCHPDAIHAKAGVMTCRLGYQQFRSVFTQQNPIVAHAANRDPPLVQCRRRRAGRDESTTHTSGTLSRVRDENICLARTPRPRLSSGKSGTQASFPRDGNSANPHTNLSVQSVASPRSSDLHPQSPYTRYLPYRRHNC